MSGKNISHEFSGNVTCILYYKAFQGIWLKTILQWGMPSFWCWNQLQLLTKLLLGFDVHNVNWFSIQLPWNSIHTDTDCELGFSLWRRKLVVIVISCCKLLSAFPLFLHLFFNPHLFLLTWYHTPISERKLKTSVEYEQSHRLYVYTV